MAEGQLLLMQFYLSIAKAESLEMQREQIKAHETKQLKPSHCWCKRKNCAPAPLIG